MSLYSLVDLSGKNNKFKILLCILIFSILAYFTWHRAIGSSRMKTNIITYRLAAKRVLTGTNIYSYKEGDPEMGMYSMYVYPPLFAILFVPFALMPFVVSVFSWFFLNFCFFFLSLYLVLKKLKLLDHTLPSFFILAFLSNVGAYSSSLSNAQVNVVILFCLSLVYYFYLDNKKFLSGLLLALGVAIKLTPLLFVVYFLIKREFKILIYFSIGIFLFFFAIPSAVFGWENNTNLLSQWFHGVPLTMGLTAFHEIHSSDQSLYVYLRRLARVFPALPVNIAWQVISSLVLAIISFFVFKSSKNNSPLVILKHFSLFACLMLFISKASNHGHFCVWLFPQLFLLILLFSRYYNKKLLVFYASHIILALMYYTIHSWRIYGFLFMANVVLIIGLLLTPTSFEMKKIENNSRAF